MAREKHAPPASEGLSADEGSTLQNIGERYTENETNGADNNYQTPGNHHERRMDRSIEENTGSIFPLPGKETLNEPITKKNKRVEMPWEIMTQHKSEDQFVFQMAPSLEGLDREGSPIREEAATGPMAMCYNEKLGLVAKTLGPKSGHWKRLARKAQNKDENVELDHTGIKRASPLTIQELEPSTLEQKRRKKEKQSNVTLKNENQMDGGEAAAVE